jgi:hypothetical protein
MDPASIFSLMAALISSVIGEYLTMADDIGPVELAVCRQP